MSIDIKTHSEAETIALGAFLGPLLEDGQTIALRGDLGAGKTHFVQGIAKGMGIDDVVVSPTFTLLNYYENTIPLQHFDFIAWKKNMNSMIWDLKTISTAASR